MLGLAFNLGRLSRDSDSLGRAEDKPIDIDLAKAEHTTILELVTAYRSNELAAESSSLISLMYVKRSASAR